jgi:ribosomal protein S18 acetylase RimI-like enzyme
MSANELTAQQINLVDATESDKEFLIEVYVGTRFDEFAMIGWDNSQIRALLEMQYDVQEQSYRMQYPQARTSIIRLENERIGRMIINSGAREIRLVDISLLPEFRNGGIGTKIINDLIKEANGKNLPVALTVAVGNPSASRLYQRLGFKITGQVELYVLMERQPDFAS